MRHSENVNRHLMRVGQEAGRLVGLCLRDKTPEAKKLEHLGQGMGNMADALTFLTEMVRDVYDKLEKIEGKLGHH